MEHSNRDQIEDVLQNDVGKFVDRINTINEFTRFQLLTNHWTPENNYIFPYSSHIKRGREEKRRPNHGHLQKFEWLLFSKEKQGIFCKYCAIFTLQSLVGRQKTVKPKKLVSEPVINFAKLTGVDGVLQQHQMTSYHSEAHIINRS